MPASQFALMKSILAAPSPVGFEAAMTEGVIAPAIEKWMPEGWALHRFRGNAGLILDSAPGRDDLLSVMVIGHADKIRMQVRSIGDDGKIWINSDSFLPCTLIGHEVVLFSENPDEPGNWRRLQGGTVEALGAIHFAPPTVRSGKVGIKADQLYLELHVHGKDKRRQITRLGIRAGDPIILDRPIRRGFSANTFCGAYLDNGLGCFVALEAARLAAEKGFNNVRLLAAFAAFEEIGRMGSRVFAGEFAPDVVVAVDVAHDYAAAPGIKDKRFAKNAMGRGFTLSAGSICTPYLNKLVQETARELEIPYQMRVSGRDTGTDAMAGVFAARDSAATSLGFPIRNMHTISESGHTGDVLAAVHVVAGLVDRLDGMNDGSGATPDDFRNNHPRLDGAPRLKRA
jgi:putative aminopeptidase FrvX